MSKTGERGQIPKRSETRRRRNKTDESGNSIEITRITADPKSLEDTTLVGAPDPNPDWHWLPKMQYEAAKRSAIRDFFEPTDWAQLFLLCETLDAHLQDQEEFNPVTGEIEMMPPKPLNGATLGAMLKGFAALMFTEGDRRRMRIEIERVNAPTGPVEAPPGVTDIRTRRLGG